MKTTYFLWTKSQVTNPISSFILRLTVAVVIWPHGAQMLLGYFGGSGYAATMQYFTQSMGIPWLLSLMVILIQFLGSLLLLAGFFTRLNALMITILTIGMIFTSHLDYGFFMNWYGNQKGEGFEYHLLLLGICVSLVWQGGGRYSVDGLLNASEK